MVRDEETLLALLRELKTLNYEFVAVTPATHDRVVARPLSGEPTLRDIFGWNRPFSADQLSPHLLRLLDRAACIKEADGQLRSLVRIANLDDNLFLHSSHPTDSPDAVFFGPDTYRFMRFVSAHLPGLDPVWAVDMGAGSGAGGIIVGGHLPSARVTLVDINQTATQLARVNARSAAVEAEILLSDQIPQGCDLVIANPPYMVDSVHRTYRDGGAIMGGQVAHEWACQALHHMVPGGTMLLYTGAAVISGQAPLVNEIESSCREAGATLQIEEIDPDVFGDELEKADYCQVERIAALGIRITKSR
jgi:methylase of polypeptide subunit release factors